ncbi:hypothetical protein GWI33_014198 [Rhynchophorus ferrugineus]|uniref:Uncharacterized protein n=1 Tax=Rhynchophorus ferrugineus TaxID=354439 RepID=A0A834I1X6_RHYFE|nr:hypothetical protein GWI33_014198 [Rhynchophorus ferrugineus]
MMKTFNQQQLSRYTKTPVTITVISSGIVARMEREQRGTNDDDGERETHASRSCPSRELLDFGQEVVPSREPVEFEAIPKTLQENSLAVCATRIW